MWILLETFLIQGCLISKVVNTNIPNFQVCVYMFILVLTKCKKVVTDKNIMFCLIMKYSHNEYINFSFSIKVYIQHMH